MNRVKKPRKKGVSKNLIGLLRDPCKLCGGMGEAE